MASAVGFSPISIGTMTRATVCLLILPIVLWTSACSRTTKLLEKAQRLEANDPAQAARIYEKVLLSDRAHRDLNLTFDLLSKRGELLLRTQQPAQALQSISEAAKLRPENSAIQLELAELLLVNGDPQAAGDIARLCLRSSPRNARALSVLGASLAVTGHGDEAIPILQHSHQIQPERHEVATMLARLLLLHDDRKDAQAVLEETTRADSSHAAAGLLLGMMAEQDGDTMRAELLYRACVKVEDSPEANLRLAQFLQRTSRFEESFALLRHMADKWPANVPLSADAMMVSGHVDDAVREYIANARKINRTATATAPTLARLSDAEIAQQARLVEAELARAETADAGTAMREKALRAARIHLEGIQDRLDPATRAMLSGELALADGDLTNAAGFADEAVRRAPDAASAHYLQAMVCRALQNLPCTNDQLTAALDRDRAYLPAHLALTESELQMGNLLGAELHAATVIRAEPGNLRALLLYSQIMRAQGRNAEALSIAQRANAASPDSIAVRLALAQAQAATGNAAAAMLGFEHILLLDPDNEAAMSGLVGVYQGVHLTRAMLARLERAAISPPQSAVLMEVAGRLYAQSGQLESAATCLRRALEMSPNSVTAHNALLALQADQLGHVTLSASSSSPELVMSLNNRAWALADRREDLGTALRMARAAASAAPQSPAIQDTLGYVLLQGGQFAAAVVPLQAAAQLAEAQGDSTTAGIIRDHLARAREGAASPRPAPAD